MSTTYLLTGSVDESALLQQLADESVTTVWRVAEGDSWRAYVQGQKPTFGNGVALELLTDLKGASHSEKGDFHYIVETDVSPASDEEFNAWYDTEHLPGLASVSGTISAKRYRRLMGVPRYIACYELTSPAVMESADWLAIRHTAWSSRVRPMFFNTTRQLFVRHGRAN